MILLLCAFVSVPVSINAFRETTLFSPPIANPRSVEFGVDMQLNPPAANFSASFAARLPITTLHIGDHAIQLGLDAGVWSDLAKKPTGDYFPVFNADYLVGFPLMYRWKGLSAAIFLGHISAHLVDGATTDELPRGKFRYSREYVQFHLSYDASFRGFFFRTYLAAGHVFHHIEKVYSTASFGGGAEFAAPWVFGVFRPMAAVDVMWNGDTNTIDQGMEVGFWLAEQTLPIAQVRATFGMYTGSDRRGMYMDAKRERFSFAIHIRFADRPR